jgi:hypothetical protein
MSSGGDARGFVDLITTDRLARLQLFWINGSAVSACPPRRHRRSSAGAEGKTGENREPWSNHALSMVRDRALFAFAARAPVAALEHMSPDRADVAVAAEHADQFANLDHGALATPRARER